MLSSRFPRVLSWVFAALVLGGFPARAIIVQAGDDHESDLLAERASHQEAVKHPAVAALHLVGGRDAQAFVGTAVYLGASHDGRKGLLLTSARLFGYDPDRPGPLAFERIQAVFRPEAATAEGKVEVPVDRVLIHPHFTLRHRALLRIPERYRDPRPSTRNDIAVLEFDLPAHGAGLEAAGIEPAVLDPAEDKRAAAGEPRAVPLAEPPAKEPVEAKRALAEERKEARPGPAGLETAEGERAPAEERKVARTGLAGLEPEDDAGTASGLALGGGWKGAGSGPALPEPAGAPRSGASLEAGCIGFGAYGTNRAMVVPDNTRPHLGRTLVTFGEFLGCQVYLNLAPMTREAVEEVETRRQDHVRMNRFEPQATPAEARLSAAAGPLRLETHRSHALMAPGDFGGPLLLDAPEGTTRVAGIGSRALYHRIAIQGGEGPADGWAIVSIWEPVRVHLPWIQRMQRGLAGGATFALVPRDGQWRCTADDGEETKLDGAGCSSCAVM